MTQLPCAHIASYSEPKSPGSECSDSDSFPSAATTNGSFTNGGSPEHFRRNRRHGPPTAQARAPLPIFQRRLAVGSFGVVHLAVLDGALVAVKVYSKPSSESSHEVAILSALIARPHTRESPHS